MHLHPARKNNESFKKYIERRQRENIMVNAHLKRGAYICRHDIKHYIDEKTKLHSYFIKPKQYTPKNPPRKIYGSLR